MRFTSAILGAVLALHALPAAAESGDFALAGRRKAARDALDELASSAPSIRRSVYIAHVARATAPDAFVACDDDGDPVVGITDSLLAVADAVAWVAAHDDEAIPAYARAFVASQRDLARVALPEFGSLRVRAVPDEGAAQNDTVVERHDAFFASIVRGIIARELIHLTEGDVRCANPTATREAGDQIWTVEEQATADRVATAVDPHRPKRSKEVWTRFEQLHLDRRGFEHFATFAAAVRRTNPKSLVYLQHHPDAS